jgi:hypothetical protein
MSKYLVLAFTNPVAGREREFNDWYENIALPTYNTIAGFRPLGRYRLADVPNSYDFQMDSQWQYLSLYEYETDDRASFSAAAKRAIANSKSYYFTEAIDKTTFFQPTFIAMGPTRFTAQES